MVPCAKGPGRARWLSRALVEPRHTPARRRRMMCAEALGRAGDRACIRGTPSRERTLMAAGEMVARSAREDVIPLAYPPFLVITFCGTRRRSVAGLVQRDQRLITEQARLADVGLRVAHVARARARVFRLHVGRRVQRRRRARLREMRPPVATLITSPLGPGAVHARSTPSTTLAT